MDDFKRIYAQFFPDGDSSTFAEHVFRRFDRDGDRKISFQEFLTALSVTARGNLDAKLNWAFDLYDVDRDGFISKVEMLEIVAVSVSVISELGRIRSLGDLQNDWTSDAAAGR